jgi:hypothetical protein
MVGSAEWTNGPQQQTYACKEGYYYPDAYNPFQDGVEPSKPKVTISIPYPSVLLELFYDVLDAFTHSQHCTHWQR